MVVRFEDDLKREMQDPEFARYFAASAARNGFGLTLARLRREAGCTQADLATRIGASQSYVAKLEGGQANPTIGQAAEVMSALGYQLRTDAIPLSEHWSSVAPSQPRYDLEVDLDAGDAISEPLIASGTGFQSLDATAK